MPKAASQYPGPARDVAVRWAQQCRAARTEQRRELGDGERSLSEVLREDAILPYRGLTRIQWVLESQPGVRKIDVRRQLAEIGIDPTREIAQLNADEVDALIDTFVVGPREQEDL